MVNESGECGRGFAAAACKLAVIDYPKIICEADGRGYGDGGTAVAGVVEQIEHWRRRL